MGREAIKLRSQEAKKQPGLASRQAFQLQALPVCWLSFYLIFSFRS